MRISMPTLLHPGEPDPLFPGLDRSTPWDGLHLGWATFP